MDYGSIDATFVDCVFENNRRNWHLRTTDKGVTLVSCTVGRPQLEDILKASRAPPDQGLVQSRRHAIIEVVNAAGQPAAWRQVTIRCEQGLPEMVMHWRQTADDNGRAGRGRPAGGSLNRIHLENEPCAGTLFIYDRSGVIARQHSQGRRHPCRSKLENYPCRHAGGIGQFHQSQNQ